MDVRSIAPEDFTHDMPSQAALEAVETEILSNPKIDTVLVNLATLIRNRNRKELTSTTDLLKEASVDAKHIAVILSSRLKNRNSLILFYLCDYNNIGPPDLLRPTPPSKALYSIALVALRKQLHTQPVSYVDGDVTVKYLTLPNVALPHIALDSQIKQSINNRVCCMISHIPVDYHIAFSVPWFRLAQSYTGDTLQCSDLGAKVFNHPEVPFNIYTHALLGDKEIIKSSLSIKQVRELVQLSVDEKWTLRTAGYVKDSLKKHGLLIIGNTYPLIKKV